MFCRREGCEWLGARGQSEVDCLVWYEPHLQVFTLCVISSHTDKGLGHVTGFGQWDISKGNTERLGKPVTLGPVLFGYSYLEASFHDLSKAWLFCWRESHMGKPLKIKSSRRERGHVKKNQDELAELPVVCSRSQVGKNHPLHLQHCLK